MKEIKFWGSNEEYGYMSNFSKHSFVVFGREYITSEHYYQSKKAKHFVDEEKIRLQKTPIGAKRLGNKCEIREDWEKVKIDIMLDALRFKFNQNPDIKEKLLKTKYAKIIEDSPYDSIWGTGKDGKGQNLLGVCLMTVREELR